MANDANLGALAEHRRGAGVGIDDLIYVSGNVGVGAGVITGGVQLEGTGEYAGEMGHLRFYALGRLCHCGSLRCWETEVGAHAIAKAIGMSESEVSHVEGVLESYDHASPELRRTGTALGHGLAGIVNAFNPRLIVLGGYLSALYPLVRAEMDAALAERALPARTRP